MNKSTVSYRYIGNGASLAGVPTRDLSEIEALEYGVKFILASGLWKKDAKRECSRDIDEILEEMNEIEESEV